MNPIAFLFMIIAAAGLTPLLYAAISSQGEQEQATVAAMQMARINKAAQGYITANAAAVEANSTATSPAVITVPMLVNTGYLPNGFNANNPYGQVWEVQVLQPAANQLQALVVSQGGQTVDAKQAGMVAQEAGGTGGVIGGGTGKFAVPGCNAGAACGVYAGWDVSTNGYQNVAPGHLAALIEYSNGQLQSDYLYRTAVPGQPQLNTMQTNLNMGANNINNANEVNAQSETLAGGQPNGQPGALQIGSNYYYGDSSNAAVRTPGSFYIQNQNGSGPAQIAEVSNVWGSGELEGGYVNSTGDVNAQYNSTANNAFAMDNGSWWANNAGDSSQSGNLWASGNINTPGFYANNNGYAGTTDTFTVGSRVILGTAFGGANIGWGCSPNGEIAANANGSGQVLACQGGSWQAMGQSAFIQNGNPAWEAFNPVGSGGGSVGPYRFCTVAAVYAGGGGGGAAVSPISGPNAYGQYNWYINGNPDTNYWIACYN
ncbi:Prepilin [Acidithiobacillus ferrivorans]|uniref:Prepilin n=3 Tax=Acidithiobacillus ferrivorans TaxID=160808 RepID=A0ABY1MK92_9PROT|nr:shufflon system plasmid conjugative transfer pilus tip adhesin PilV [Acidithiobacillus ferrivorans]SMH64181.1 Prepilin [Acidithiobacillus ferrivorans]